MRSFNSAGSLLRKTQVSMNKVSNSSLISRLALTHTLSSSFVVGEREIQRASATFARRLSTSEQKYTRRASSILRKRMSAQLSSFLLMYNRCTSSSRRPRAIATLSSKDFIVYLFVVWCTFRDIV